MTTTSTETTYTNTLPVQTTATISFPIAYPQLSPTTNFDNWKFRVKLILEERQILDAITGEEEANPIHDARAKSILVQYLTDKYINIIRKAKTAKEMMRLLEDVFERKSTMNKLYLKRKLITLKCKTDLQDHFLTFDNIVNDLESTGQEVSEIDKVCYLLSSLPEEYEPVIIAIETMETTNLKLDFAKARLLDAEIKIKNKSHNQIVENLFATIVCYTCGRKGHKSFECTDKSQSKQQNNNFSTRGRGTPNNRRGRNQSSRGGRGPGRGSNNTLKSTGTATTVDATHAYNSEMALAANYESDVNQNTEANTVTFVIDSWTSEHLVQDKFTKFMTNIVDLDHEIKIKVANGQYLMSNQKGKLRFKYCEITLTIEALIIKDLVHNLLSVRRLNSKGLTVTFENHVTKTSNSENSIFAELYGNLYILRAEFIEPEVNCMLSNDNDIWHKRLGHLNRKSLRLMDLPCSQNVCGVCIEGKANRLPFREAIKPRSKTIAELLYTDIAGPFKVETLQGEKYYQTITDDYSHFCVVFTLTNKSEATNNLIGYIKKLENQTDKRVKRIRCDNGGEFTANKLKNYC